MSRDLRARRNITMSIGPILTSRKRSPITPHSRRVRMFTVWLQLSPVFKQKAKFSQAWLTPLPRSVRIRSFLPASAPQWHPARHFQRHYLQISDSAMDTTCLSEGGTHMLCGADRGYGDQTRPIYWWRGKGIPSISRRVVKWKRCLECEWIRLPQKVQAGVD